MYAHGQLPDAAFFLLALPDRFYLWRNGADTSSAAQPDYSVDARPLLAPYLERSGVSSAEIGERGLELVLSSWLEKLVRWQDDFKLSESEEWLCESGLLDRVKGGRIEVQALA